VSPCSDATENGERENIGRASFDFGIGEPSPQRCKAFLMADGRDIEPMKMQIGRGSGNGAAAARVRLVRGLVRMGWRGLRVRQGKLVFQVQNDFVAGIHAQRWTLDAVAMM
jgi:hypothetical protein